MIEGKNITLRALEPEDVNCIYEWENNTSEWNAGDMRTLISKSDIQSLINHSDLDIYQTRQMRLMIVNKTDNQTIGCIDMFDFDPFNMHASIGILIKEKYRRRGLATDAVNTFSKYLFDFLNLKSILATVQIDNVASSLLFKSCNFDHIGTYKSWMRRKNGFIDVEIFQLCNI